MLLHVHVHVYCLERPQKRSVEHYLVHMDEHHEGIPFTGRILLLFKKRVHQFWGIRNEEIKVSGETEIFLNYIIVLKSKIEQQTLYLISINQMQFTYMYIIQGSRKAGDP